MRPPTLARLTGLCAALMLAAATGPAWGLLLTVNPRAAAGVTTNAYGATNDEAAARSYRDVFWSAGISSGLTWNLPRANHHLSYGFNTTHYVRFGGADFTSHNAALTSSFTLTPRLTLGFGATAALFRASAVPAVDPLTTSVTNSALTAGASVLTTSVGQSLSYEPNGVDKYTEGLSAALVRPLMDAGALPKSLYLNGTVRRDHTRGRNTYSGTLSLGDFFLIDAPVDANGLATGHVVSATVLGGWRRDLSVRSTAEIQAGVLALYGVETHGGSVGPSVVGTLSYRLLPWFATLIVSQQPSMSIYGGEALVTDGAVARVSLPINRRENTFLAGSAGYTYARRVTSDKRFAVAERVYDAVSVGASLFHVLTRWPIGMGVDYTLGSQRGSNLTGRYYPSSIRSTLGVSIGGSLAWGEGNRGWLQSR